MVQYHMFFIERCNILHRRNSQKVVSTPFSDRLTSYLVSLLIVPHVLLHVSCCRSQWLSMSLLYQAITRQLCGPLGSNRTFRCLNSREIPIPFVIGGEKARFTGVCQECSWCGARLSDLTEIPVPAFPPVVLRGVQVPALPFFDLSCCRWKRHL